MRLQVEWKRRLCIAGIIIGVYLSFRYLLPVLIPFLIGWALASWVYPLCAKIEKRTHIPKNVTGTVLMIVVLGILGLLFWKGAGIFFQQIKTAVANYDRMADWLENLLDQCCRSLESLLGISSSISREYILGGMEAVQKKMTESFRPETFLRAVSCLKSVLLLLSAVVVTLISGILSLGDMEVMKRRIQEYSMLRGARRVVRRLKKTTVVYLKAQFLIIISVAAVCCVGFWMMGSPYYLVLGCAIGLLDALPVIGTGTFLYPAALLFLVRGEYGIAIGCVALDVVTSLLREFMEPRLLGKRLGIFPVVILASVYVGFWIYGPLGFVLGPLSLSVVYEIGKEWDVWD